MHGTRSSLHGAWSASKLHMAEATADQHRPGKKRCQYRVVYNIPVLPSSPTSASKPVEGDAAAASSTAASASAPASDKPEMTANPTQCPSAALRVAGDCPHCTKVFCGSHRTPEAHHW